MPGRERLVVIGNGMAGARAVEEIVSRAPDKFDITLFGEEPYGNYNRILLSSVLNQAQGFKDIFLHPLEWYQKHGITLVKGVRVISIDRDGKRVHAANGMVSDYDRLIIATGSRPFVPPMAGLYLADGKSKPGVFVFRTIEDCSKIAGYAIKSRRAAVIGGGLLGLEAARGVANFGVDVTVVHLGQTLMSAQLDAHAGRLLKRSVENLGISVRLQSRTVEVLGGENVTGLKFEDGSALDCDMVIVATGIVANTELALESGLTVEQAIVVDDQMRSVQDASIYAVGECAQHRGMVYGVVAPLWEQAEVLADHITGRNSNAAYSGSKLAIKLKVMGIELASMGIIDPRDEDDEVIVFAEHKRGIYKKLVIREDRLVGAILLGDLGKSAYLVQAFDRETPLAEDRLSILFDLSEPATTNSLLAMPDDARVCNCAGVTKGTIRKCVLSGTKDVRAVMDTTRAGTGCGSCKKLVEEIVLWTSEQPLDSDQTLPNGFGGLRASREELAAAVEEQDLRSVSEVCEAFVNREELEAFLKSVWGSNSGDTAVATVHVSAGN